MRLICPNCGAQYEVDERVIPDSGRDVQCSACGHAWYQMPFGDEDQEQDLALPESEVSQEPEAGEQAPPEGAASPEEAAPSQEPEPEAAQEPEAEPEPEAAQEPEPEPEPEPVEPPEESEPREVSDDVSSILKEEAEREMAQRAAEQVETQPDLGLEAGPSPDEERRRIARERLARMRGLDEDEDLPDLPDTATGDQALPAEPEPQVPRRDLFPDIEEINSTLDGHGVSGDAAGATDVAERSGGFGRGFFLMIFIAALLMAVYLLAPNLAKTVPVLEPVLTAYVEAVNAARIWLDETLQRITGRIETMGEC